MPKLVHSCEGQFLEDIFLEEGSWLIGRRPECEIRVDDETISGKYAKITVVSSAYMGYFCDVHKCTESPIFSCFYREAIEPLGS